MTSLKINPTKIVNNQRRFFVDISSEINQRLADELNTIGSDVEKIFEFEKLRGQQNKIIIIDKKKSVADVYNGDKIIDSFKIGVGEKAGDELNSAEHIKGEFTCDGRTTPSGQFLAENSCFGISKKDYDDGKCVNYFILKGVQHPTDFKSCTQIGLHQIPHTHPERFELFEKDCRRGMSSGCVNFIPDDFYKLAEEINPKNTVVYILPEEEGNKFISENLPQGIWMRTKYFDENKENIFVNSMKKFFGLV